MGADVKCGTVLYRCVGGALNLGASLGGLETFRDSGFSALVRSDLETLGSESRVQRGAWQRLEPYNLVTLF